MVVILGNLESMHSDRKERLITGFPEPCVEFKI